MNILALDIGRKTGWAISTDTHGKGSGEKIFEPPKKGRKKIKDEPPGKQFRDFLIWLREMVRDNHINRIVFEEPGGAAGRDSSLKLFGYRAIVLMVAAGYDIEVRSIYPNSLKKWATGDGRADKEAMLAALEDRLGISHPDLSDNQIDAIWLMIWAKEEAFKNAKD